MNNTSTGHREKVGDIVSQRDSSGAKTEINGNDNRNMTTKKQNMMAVF